MSVKREEYTAKIKIRIDDLNKKIDVLEANADEVKEEVRANYEMEMTKIRLLSKQAVAKLEELKLGGEASWEKMVAEMEKICDAFIHSVRYFKSEI